MVNDNMGAYKREVMAPGSAVDSAGHQGLCARNAALSQYACYTTRYRAQCWVRRAAAGSMGQSRWCISEDEQRALRSALATLTREICAVPRIQWKCGRGNAAGGEASLKQMADMRPPCSSCAPRRATPTGAATARGGSG